MTRRSRRGLRHESPCGRPSSPHARHRAAPCGRKSARCRRAVALQPSCSRCASTAATRSPRSATAAVADSASPSAASASARRIVERANLASSSAAASAAACFDRRAPAGSPRRLDRPPGMAVSPPKVPNPVGAASGRTSRAGAHLVRGRTVGRRRFQRRRDLGAVALAERPSGQLGSSVGRHPDRILAGPLRGANLRGRATAGVGGAQFVAARRPARRSASGAAPPTGSRPTPKPMAWAAWRRALPRRCRQPP